jgi:hypothetical protein
MNHGGIRHKKVSENLLMPVLISTHFLWMLRINLIAMK